jgi:hypothetical protein
MPKEDVIAFTATSKIKDFSRWVGIRVAWRGNLIPHSNFLADQLAPWT